MLRLAITFTPCPLVTAAPNGVDTLGQSSREATNFVPHPVDFHLMIHSTQPPHPPPLKIFGITHSFKRITFMLALPLDGPYEGNG